jgi:hypothetical protein
MTMSGSSFWGDLLDDVGVPLMRLYLGKNERDNAWVDEPRFSDFRDCEDYGLLRRWISNENGLRRQSIM